MTNLHYYYDELFYTIIDMQLLELNNQFNEANMELFLCVVFLSPCESFATLSKENLIRHA